MLLTSVVLILQETLEAALLFSILAVVTLQHGGRPRDWLPAGLVSGLSLALVYALNLKRVSEWFDYVGQELVNAALQLGIVVAVFLLAAWLGRARNRPIGAGMSRFGALCAVTIALAITREGSEIAVFIGGFIGQPGAVQAVGAGSVIGFGIGVSVGLLLFYGLFALGAKPGRAGRIVPLALLSLFSGNMLSQAALQLIQADWLSAGATLWDSSAWLPEPSVAGRLLYALVGYESRPGTTQAVAYALGVLAVPGAYFVARSRRR